MFINDRQKWPDHDAKKESWKSTAYNVQNTLVTKHVFRLHAGDEWAIAQHNHWQWHEARLKDRIRHALWFKARLMKHNNKGNSMVAMNVFGCCGFWAVAAKVLGITCRISVPWPETSKLKLPRPGSLKLYWPMAWITEIVFALGMEQMNDCK